jgi:hypothetical protein
MLLTFHELEVRYGPDLAHQYLVEIERNAAIDPEEMLDVDPQMRLDNALKASRTPDSPATQEIIP